MEVGVALIGVDILVVAVLTVLIGASAPHWPTRWLEQDRGPLRLHGVDHLRVYRRWRVPALARRLPEAGSAFGGESKKALPGIGADDLGAYLVEVRRGEWVHWLSMLTALPLGLFNPLWLWVAFAFIVVVVNAAFILVLRYNRIRLVSILQRGVA